MIEDRVTGRKERIKIDLYEKDQVSAISKNLAEIFCQDIHQIEAELSQLTNEIEHYRENQIIQIKYDNLTKRNFQPVPPNKEEQIIKFLKSPDLIKKIDNLIEQAGVTGEENTRKLLFVIASSYKTNYNLHCLIQGISGSGKSHLVNTIGQCMPPEDVLSITRITGKSLYYYTHGELINKLLLIQDFDGLNDEAQYAFRELQSSGVVSSSITYKDKSGNILSTIRTVNSHFASLIVTTKSEIYYDNMSRCIVAGINESKDQTQKIIEYQNKKIMGHVMETNENNSKEFLQNCIRCLKNADVINPYADKVNLPNETHMSRRLNYHFQQFIMQVTLLYQHQRKRDHLNRLITEPVDIKIACDILFESIMMKVDDMNISLRQFFEKLKEYISRISTLNHLNYEFSQREIRLALNLCKTTCKENFSELVQLEYIGKTGGSSNRGYKYRIIYWDDHLKIKTNIMQLLTGQIKSIQKLADSGGRIVSAHQNSRGTRGRPLVVANSEHPEYKGGKK